MKNEDPEFDFPLGEPISAAAANDRRSFALQLSGAGMKRITEPAAALACAPLWSMPGGAMYNSKGFNLGTPDGDAAAFGACVGSAMGTLNRGDAASSFGACFSQVAEAAYWAIRDMNSSVVFELGSAG